MTETTLQDCLKAVIDNRGVTPHKRGTEWQDSGVPVLSANNVKTSGLQKLDEIRYIPEEVYSSWMKIPLEKGDIILTSEAPAGEVYYWDSEEKVVLGQRLYGLKIKDGINPKYLKYYLQSTVGQKAIQGQNSGSTVFGIAAATFPYIQINLLEKAEQDLVADLLYAIDSKIANNTTICSDLEAMAKLLYDYWFVQFDFPDENGRPYKSSGGKMVWNEELKREIPEGWEVMNVSGIASLQQEAVFPTNGIEYYHYSIPFFDETKMPSCEDGNIIASNKYIVPKDSVLVSKLNPQFKRIWLILEPQKNAICSTEFLPIKAEAVGIFYLYELLNSEAYSVHLRQKASSSTGSRKRIDPDNCLSFQFAYNKEVAMCFNSRVSAWIKQANAIPMENQELADLRDFLLPMLMNGQVKVESCKE